MEYIAKHPYYKVEREVTAIEQKNIEYERMLYLYEDKIKTYRREFPAEQVFDISYREVTAGEAILYLHTSRGVFSYPTKEDPTDFISAFKDLEKRVLEREARKYD
jgi:hypothetical protein